MVSYSETCLRDRVSTICSGATEWFACEYQERVENEMERQKERQRETLNVVGHTAYSTKYDEQASPRTGQSIRPIYGWPACRTCVFVRVLSFILYLLLKIVKRLPQLCIDRCSWNRFSGHTVMRGQLLAACQAVGTSKRCRAKRSIVPQHTCSG